jgi:uncharacterized protein YecA (UPF0149 family)
MGAIAEAMVAYTQPLIDQTDGSMEQMNKALAISQLCWNIALMPKDRQDETLSEMQTSLQLDDDEFDDFRRSILVPMIERHEEMFPGLHGNYRFDSPEVDFSPQATPRQTAPVEKYPGTERYAPCPCNSGKKYKFCCGAKSR